MLSTVELKQIALDLGLLRVGVCAAQPPPHYEVYRAWLESGNHGSMDYLAKHLPLKAHPKTLLPGCQSVVAVALDYNQAVHSEPGQPKIAKYALGRDYHKVLRGKLKRLQSALGKMHPAATWRICVDSAPIMERDFAQLAGIGWFGKNTCLIDSRFGSFFVIGLLLSDLEFEPDSPATGGCGSCTKCIDACPTGAIEQSGDHWQVVASRCISYQTIEHKGPLEAGIGEWTFGCDVCQDVCPFNQPRHSQPERAKTTQEPDFLRRTQWPSLVELSQISEERWDVLTQGSPVRRAGLEGLRRNADLNLLGRQEPNL